MSKPINFASRCARREFPRRQASTSPQRSAPRPDLAVRPRNLKSFNDIPGPLALPMLRHAAHVLPRIGNFHHTVGVGLLDGMRQRYGQLVRLAKASRKRPVLYVFDPDMMLEVYESGATKPPRWERSPLAAQRGEHNSCPMHGNEHRNLWPAMQDVLQDRTFLEHYNGAFDKIADDATKRLGELRSGGNALNEELETEVYRWALENIGMLVFGTRLGCLDGPIHLQNDHKKAHIISIDDVTPELCSLSKRCSSELSDPERLVLCTRQIAEGSYLVRSESTLRPTSDTYVKAVKTLQEHYSLIDTFLQKAIQELNSGLLRPEQILLKELLPLERRLLPLAADIFLAGVDSLVQSTLCLLYVLSQYPAQQQRAHDEVRCLDEGGESRQYVRACVTEAARLMPPSSGVVRRSEYALAVGGFEVPAGVDIVLAHGVSSRCGQHFPRPHSFIPERWCDHCVPPLRATNAHALASMPFGEYCPFSNTADTMLEALVARVVSKYRIEWHGARATQPTLHKPHYFVLQNAA